VCQHLIEVSLVAGQTKLLRDGQQVGDVDASLALSIERVEQIAIFCQYKQQPEDTVKEGKERKVKGFYVQFKS